MNALTLRSPSVFCFARPPYASRFAFSHASYPAGMDV